MNMSYEGNKRVVKGVAGVRKGALEMIMISWEIGVDGIKEIIRGFKWWTQWRSDGVVLVCPWGVDVDCWQRNICKE